MGTVSHESRTGSQIGVEFGWKVHESLDSWTAKVDTKASIVLAIESAIVGFVVTLSTSDGPLANLRDTRLFLFRAGLLVIAIAALLSLAVVFPQLARRRARQNWSSGMIYFGHLRHWDPQDLAKALEHHVSVPEQLASQLVVMSKIAWRKHAWLQWSLASLIIGSILTAMAGIGR